MTGWRYEVHVCKDGGSDPSDHDGSCGFWTRAGSHWNEKWFGAFEEASLCHHAIVEAIPVGIDPDWKPHIVFEYVQGGGLCKGCWDWHVNTHTEHVISGPRGWCQPCLDAQKSRGPLTRTPTGREFMCEDCRAAFRRNHERNAYLYGRDPDSRLYRPVFDVAREDAGEGCGNGQGLN